MNEKPRKLPKSQKKTNQRHSSEEGAHLADVLELRILRGRRCGSDGVLALGLAGEVGDLGTTRRAGCENGDNNGVFFGSRQSGDAFSFAPRFLMLQSTPWF
jgi:hypothetical protein